MTDTTRDLIQRLADALHDAAEDVEGWGNYASRYSQEKHDLPGNIAKIHAQAEEARAYLAQPEPEYPSDKELLELMPETMRDEFSYAAKVCSDATGGQVEPGIFRVALNTAALEYAQLVLTRWGNPFSAA